MVPLVGTIAAGVPITAHENIEALVPVPQEMIRNVKTAFALRVKGDSMINAHIVEGDVVVLQDIFIFRQSGICEEGKLLGRLVPTGVRPKFYERLENSGIRIPTSVFIDEGENQ